jgi:hypothetical protein
LWIIVRQKVHVLKQTKPRFFVFHARYDTKVEKRNYVEPTPEGAIIADPQDDSRFQRKHPSQRSELKANERTSEVMGTESGIQGQGSPSSIGKGDNVLGDDCDDGLELRLEGEPSSSTRGSASGRGGDQEEASESEKKRSGEGVRNTAKINNFVPVPGGGADDQDDSVLGYWNYVWGDYSANDSFDVASESFVDGRKGTKVH